MTPVIKFGEWNNAASMPMCKLLILLMKIFSFTRCINFRHFYRLKFAHTVFNKYTLNQARVQSGARNAEHFGRCRFIAFGGLQGGGNGLAFKFSHLFGPGPKQR
jgi:hypothetical protein